MSVAGADDPTNPDWRPGGDPARFVVHEVHPFNGGPPPWVQRASFVTPTDLFFVRSHGAVPTIDAGTFSVEVSGMVERQLQLSLADLGQSFRRRRVLATIVCAGQRRVELGEVEPIAGELPWGAEAVGTAWWEGWPLTDVLAAAGTLPGARHVTFLAADDVSKGGNAFHYGASIPLAKALAPEVLLADRMNGALLPAVHGAPVRVLVPGYIGARQVKWVRRIVVGADPHDGYFQAVAYRLYPTAMRHHDFDPAAGFELGELAVNCVLCTPRPGDAVPAGPVTVTGYAYAGGGRTVERVEVSGDGGESWTVARLGDGDERAHVASDPDRGRWAWRFFDATVAAATTGEVEVVARAWDSAGQTQPATPAEVWNLKGYANNAWSRLRVRRGA